MARETPTASAAHRRRDHAWDCTVFPSVGCLFTRLHAGTSPAWRRVPSEILTTPRPLRCFLGLLVGEQLASAAARSRCGSPGLVQGANSRGRWRVPCWSCASCG
jgi:hypothetical protein